MNYERAYGIIPLRRKDQKWQVLLVNHVKGNYWGFPKGHAAPGETPKETAIRELFEETQLRVKLFLREESLRERYNFTRGEQPIDKEVSYFLAEVEGNVVLQPTETQSSLWIDLDKAEAQITFSQSKVLLNQVKAIFFPS